MGSRHNFALKDATYEYNLSKINTHVFLEHEEFIYQIN
jgi:hypothetical protein